VRGAAGWCALFAGGESARTTFSKVDILSFVLHNCVGVVNVWLDYGWMLGFTMCKSTMRCDNSECARPGRGSGA
jgi:hypothetical protein